MEEEKVYRQTFENGVDSDTADELLPPGTVRDMLNVDVFSADGDRGIVTNVMGNIQIPFELPEGRNRTISRPILDEENNRFFFFVWNSNGYHTIYEYDHVTQSVSPIFRDKVSSGEVEILKWKETDLIVHSDIVDGNKLYWACKGHPPRKVNITKLKNNGYGDLITDYDLRAYKRSSAFAPIVEYGTDLSVTSNLLYGNLFKFATRWIYDDAEKSHFSDYSKVPIPDTENISGIEGVPRENNFISVKFNSGSSIVKKIELIMQKTNNIDGGFLDWVSIGIFDKAVLGIVDGTDYEYRFFNNVPYIPIPQPEVILPYSMMPRDPACQIFADNAMIYTNFTDGYDPVVTDVDVNVSYTDLFIDSSSTPELNSPFIQINEISRERRPVDWLGTGTRVRRFVTSEVIIGPDVKKGNKYRIDVNIEYQGGGWYTVTVWSKVATRSDDSSSMATDLSNSIRAIPRLSDGYFGTWVGPVSVDSLGNARFQFNSVSNQNADYVNFGWEAFPVEYASLEDSGNSVVNRKLGSSIKAYIVYGDSDTKRSLSYPINKEIQVSSLNNLGRMMSASISYIIKHLPPEWATTYQIYETKDLVHQDFIQILIQRKTQNKETTLGNSFQDLVIGSLHTYQQIHPNNTLRYEFKKGDRVKLLMVYTEQNPNPWAVSPTNIEYEVIDYFPTVVDQINRNITTTNSNTIETDLPDQNNVGSQIRVRGYTRTITGVVSNGYQIDAPILLDSGNNFTEPGYEIINNRGVLRIKEDPAYPIPADGVDVFSLVQVYKPYREGVDSSNEISYAIGEKFDIYEIDGVKYHTGNNGDQTPTTPAVVVTGGIDCYVRNREMPLNNNIKNPQTILAQIEDRSFSDFYYSDLSSYGRPSIEDDGRGVVHLGSASAFSNNFISGTSVNGLSMFVEGNRVDYNDSYGDINRMVFHEGRAYIFKALKVGFIIVKGNIINSGDGVTNIVGITRDLMPDKMEYFVWEGGIGKEVDAVVRDGNDVFYVSPNSGVLARIGYSGTEPVSKQSRMDKDIRDVISEATISGANIHLGYDRKKGNVTMAIDPYFRTHFDDSILLSNSSLVPTPVSGEWQIVTYPYNGTLSLSPEGDVVYEPNVGFIGLDFFSYRSGDDGVERFVYINVITGT